jgi:hypothetical protein
MEKKDELKDIWWIQGHLKCDYEGCSEYVRRYRKWKGKVVKLCIKHNEQMSREHLGKQIDASELDEDDIRFLEEKTRKEDEY